MFQGEPAPAPCGPSLSADSAVTLLACGSLILVDWQTGWRVEQGHVIGLRGLALDLSDQDAPLGFYVAAADPLRVGLRVEVAFQRPLGRHVRLELHDAIVNGVTTVPADPVTALLDLPPSAVRVPGVK
jgi:hypothetical protein